MKLIYTGKTKDVYENPNGTYTLKLKDDATGTDGVFDPGANAVGLTIEGLGRESLRITKHFFELLTAAGIPHHFISCDIDTAEMVVHPANHFGEGVEFICRCKADGSFVRRYGAYVQKSAELDYFVEATLKDNDRHDPPISEDALVVLGLMTREEYAKCKALTQGMTKIVEKELLGKGLTLFDIKFEFARKADTGEVILIDEFSAGIMRVYRNGVIVPPLGLGGYLFKGLD